MDYILDQKEARNSNILEEEEIKYKNISYFVVFVLVIVIVIVANINNY